MDFEDILELIFVIIMLYEARECLEIMSTRRKFWVRPLYHDRDISGFFAANFEEMYSNDPEEFIKTVRMNKEVFDLLFTLVKEDITKHSNRPSISAKCRLFLTLAYLAHGGSKQMYSFAFKMGLTTVKRIIAETCDTIWDSLGCIYLSVPQEDEWKRIAQDFEQMWNFPHCVGAIDCKRIAVTCPPNSNNIVMLAACDSNYTFTSVDIGTDSYQSDSGLLLNSNFGEKLFNGHLGLPEDEFLPDTTTKCPYFFVGDAAFPLKSCLMRPYPGSHLPPDRLIFNKRLSRARRVIENAFGILAARWRILLSPLQMNPSNAEKIVKAAVVLHNFIKMHDDSYCPADFVDRYEGDTVIDGLWRQEVRVPLQRYGRMMSNNASRTAFMLRDELMGYMCSNPL